MLDVVVRFPSAWPRCGLVRRLEEGAQWVSNDTYRVGGSAQPPDLSQQIHEILPDIGHLSRTRARYLL